MDRLTGRSFLPLVLVVVDGSAARRHSFIFLVVTDVRVDGSECACLLRLFDYFGEVALPLNYTHFVHALVGNVARCKVVAT